MKGKKIKKPTVTTNNSDDCEVCKTGVEDLEVRVEDLGQGYKELRLTCTKCGTEYISK